MLAPNRKSEFTFVLVTVCYKKTIALLGSATKKSATRLDGWRMSAGGLELRFFETRAACGVSEVLMEDHTGVY